MTITRCQGIARQRFFLIVAQGSGCRAAPRHWPESAWRAGPRAGDRAMNELIAAAILERRRLQFTYNGELRLVEPQCYGVGHTGTELLRAHQLRGGVTREPLFEVGKMRDLQVLGETFTRPGPNYRKNDSVMRAIFCQL
jgi:predicted DNA-binding transcriptional regulator YafY